MKKVILSIALLAATASVSAQSMLVNMKDGSQTVIPVSQIQDVTYQEAAQAAISIQDLNGNTVTSLPTVANVASTLTLVVESTTDYTVTLPSWMQQTTIDEPVDGQIYIHVDAWTDTSQDRTGTIVVTSKEDSKISASVTVTQPKYVELAGLNPRFTPYALGGYITLQFDEPGDPESALGMMDRMRIDYNNPMTGRDTTVYSKVSGEPYWNTVYVVARARYGRTYNFTFTAVDVDGAAIGASYTLRDCYSLPAPKQWSCTKVPVTLSASNVRANNVKSGSQISYLYDGNAETAYIADPDAEMENRYITIDLGEELNQVVFEFTNPMSSDILEGVDFYIAGSLQEKGEYATTFMSGWNYDQGGVSTIEYPTGCTKKQSTVASKSFRYISLNNDYNSVNWGLAELKVYKLVWAQDYDPETQE